ncbi:MAG TPA: glycosyltransferase family 2 protein [Actinomycetota bacterium]|nr:glycosyltransferase family 2 protein [Actinomycetota bacterium]
MSAETRVAAVVVDHDSAPEIYGCLRALASSDEPVRVVVVDNASTDGSPDRIAAEHPGVALVRSPRNLGFGGGVNLGAREADEPYLLLMNPDATPEPAAIGRLVDLLERTPRAAAAGPLVLNPDGSIQPSKRAFPSLWHSALHGLVGPFWTSNPGTRAYILADAPMDEPVRVGWLSASAVLLRRSAFDEVGGFDEDFFFFVEDVDLCRRLVDAGWEMWFEPRARVVHTWGGSWTKRPLRHLWMHHRNLFRYVTKHRRGAWVLAYPAIVAGLALRFVMLVLRWVVARNAVPSHRSGVGRGQGDREDSG